MPTSCRKKSASKRCLPAPVFSTSGCRSQYAWLVDNGFLVPVRSETDKRRQTVIPGDALKEKFKLLLQATAAD